MDLTTVDHLLTTTRSVKKRMDYSRPVEPEILERCIEISLCAPTGANFQGWSFVIVTDPDKRAGITDYYRKGRDAVAGRTQDGPQRAYSPPRWREGDVRSKQHQGMINVSDHLHEHFHEIPAHIIGCIDHEMPELDDTYHPQFESFHAASLYGSIIQAGWSIMLALRARGIGSAWTTAHLVYEKEVAELLDIPDNVTQAFLLPCAYFTGTDFKPLKRRPVQELTHWNGWGKSR